MDGYDKQTGEIGGGIPTSPTIAAPGRFASPTTAVIDAALVKAQAAFQPPQKTKTAKIEGRANYSYSYAPLEDVIAALREPLTKNNLWFQQYPIDGGNGLRLRTIIFHASGEWIGCDFPIFSMREGAQGFASGATYARRYGLMLALGVAAEDDDDLNVADGKQATVQPTGRPAQRAAAASAAPSSPERDKALARWKEMRDEIDKSPTVADVDALLVSPAWSTMVDLVHQAEGREKAEGAVQQLKERAERRKYMLLGDTDNAGEYAR